MTDQLKRLLNIMARLRDPETGCAWDVQQTFATIAPYTIEEAYEVLDAIQRGNMADLKEELGDLLLQVVFHSRMAEEAGHFNFDDTAKAIADKLERRHPHVFGQEGRIGAEEVHKTWNERKKAEKQAAGKGGESILGDIPPSLPALMKAVKIQEKAATVGFEWPSYHGALEKLKEELAELEQAIAAGQTAKIQDEMGDLLFSICNLSRYFKVSPEMALSGTIQKFKDRFQYIEKEIKSNGEDINDKTLEELDNLWYKAKKTI